MGGSMPPLSAVIAVTVVLFVRRSMPEIVKNVKCDLYDGSWVFDKSYPLNRSETCPFMIQQFNCTGNGRPDLHYQNYRWQPHSCNLPRLVGRELARSVRGKRLMFVGDSLSMNQWLSLACIIHAANPTAHFRPTQTAGLLSTISLPALNIKLMYLRNPFLVDVEVENGNRVMKLDSVALGSELWLSTDILIFDTWHWWLHSGRKQQWDLIQDGNVTVKDMDRLEAYGKALMTWGKWVDLNVDTQKVNVFFQGVSPDHWNGSDWGMPELQRCGGEEKPLERPMEEGDVNKANLVLKHVLNNLKKPVHLLDVAELSEFRVDGHPSIYGNPRHVGMDCTHWCLPGIPDTWNQLLYASLLSPNT